MTAWLDLTGLPFTISWVDAAGIRTRSLRAGEGPDVVFLHGTSGHLEAFTRNIRAHVDAGYRCHAIDMLGHGYTDKPNYDYEIPRYVDHLRDYLDACDIATAHLAGESLGGWVSAAFAAEYPLRVRSLQLIAAGGTKANPAVMERIKTSTLQAVTENDIELTRQRLNLLMHDPGPNVSDELVEVRHRIYHQPDFVANIGHLLCLQDMTIRQRNLLTPETLGKLAHLHTLIIWGMDNPFGDVPEARKMHEDIPNSTLELFDRCGHWPQHEQADRYNRLALDFLAASDRRTAT